MLINLWRLTTYKSGFTMTDVLTRKQRSYNMAMIHATNTKPELKLRKLLSAAGLRYRLHHRLTGKPDIVFVSKKLAVFIDGCFWHRCPKDFVKPETRRKFWLTKIAGNVRRDKEVNRLLAKDGWKVLRIWEHEVRKNPEKCRDNILAVVKRRKTAKV